MVRRIASWLVLYYLRFWAKTALFFHQSQVIGITGSVGKSSTRNAVFSILKDYYPTKVIRKGNSETGIPLGILGLTVRDYSFLDWLRLILLSPLGIFSLRGIRYLIIEMGVDHPYPPKNMGYLLTIVKPDIGVFLNVYPVHTMQFEKGAKGDLLERIAYEKGKIITQSGCQKGIFNNDNPYVKKQISKVNPRLKKQEWLSFGKGKGNDLFYLGYRLNLSGSNFKFFVKSKGEIELSFNNYLLPKVYEEVFGAAILVGLSVGLDLEKIKAAIEKNFQMPKGRGSVFKGIKDSIIIDSSYNASRPSVLAFLMMAYQLKKRTKRKLVFVFGDMRELGGEAKQEHQTVAKAIVGKVDYLYCVGPLTKRYVVKRILRLKPENSNLRSKNQPLPKEIKWFKTSIDVGKYLKKNIPSKSVVLFKGSQNTIFLEEGIKYLLKKEDDFKNLCRQSNYWKKVKSLCFY